jgi:hypothetical protein
MLDWHHDTLRPARIELTNRRQGNNMSQKDELKNRVEAKKLNLQAKIKEPQADASSESREEMRKLQAKLDTLGESVKEGWDDLTEKVSGKLNEWLKND